MQSHIETSTLEDFLMIVLSQDQKTLTDCESVTVNKNGEGEGFILNAKTANNEIVIGHFSTEQEAKNAAHDLFLGTQLGISVTVPCQKERDEEAEEHERMIKHLKEIIFSDTEGLDDEDEFEPEDKKSSGKPSRCKRGKRR